MYENIVICRKPFEYKVYISVKVIKLLFIQIKYRCSPVHLKLVFSQYPVVFKQK